jgi:hypothetical protein
MFRRFLASAALLGAALFTGPAVADETWTSPVVGEIIWAEDVGHTSIFTYQTPSGQTVYMYIEGLNANIENRRVMTGSWMIGQVGAEDGQCGAGLTGIDGRVSYTWGHFRMRWQQRGFPSAWTADMTSCFAGQRETIRARPNVGG